MEPDNPEIGENIVATMPRPKSYYERVYESERIGIEEFMANHLNGCFAFITSHGRKWDKENGFHTTNGLKNYNLAGSNLDRCMDLKPQQIRAVRLKLLGYKNRKISEIIGTGNITIGKWFNHNPRVKEYYLWLQAEADREAIKMAAMMPILEVPEMHPAIQSRRRPRKRKK